jgi:hypothetical protein
VETFVGVAGSESYILTITENKGASASWARYAVKKGDTYELLTGDKKSAGTVKNVSSVSGSKKYTLEPKAEQGGTKITAPEFDVTVDTAKSGITKIENVITFEDNTTAPAPASIEFKGGVTTDGLFYLENDADITIVVYRGTKLDVTIPSTIANKPVKTIGWKAFTNTNITSVIIPDGVTSIEWAAFQYCDNLKSASIPGSVTTWNWSAFDTCKNLANVTLGNGLTSIGDGAFSSCYSLASVTIPSTVTEIGKYAFLGCSFTTVTIPNGVTRIDDGTYCQNDNLTSIIIPSGVTFIGDWAFGMCTGLTSITIPANVTKIGRVAFWGCDSLTSVTFQGTISSDKFGVDADDNFDKDSSPFDGDLRDKYAGPGTYTTIAHKNDEYPIWAKQN